MSLAAGPFMIAAGLLVVAGIAKAWRPGDTANALREAGVPASSTIVRVGALVEAAIGGYALIDGGVLAAALLTASYVAFASFVVLALGRDTPLATCGCFGRADTPPDALHLIVNLGAAAVGAAVVLDPGVGVATATGELPLDGAPLFLLVAIGIGAVVLILTNLAQTLALVRRSAQT